MKHSLLSIVMCLFRKLCYIPFISTENWVSAALLTDQKWEKSNLVNKSQSSLKYVTELDFSPSLRR